MTADLGLLEQVFGPGEGNTPEARAKTSSKLFVRGLDLLTVETPKATGRRLTAQEALTAYGYDKLCEVIEDGSAILTTDPTAVGRTLHERRNQLGLDVRTVSAKTRIPQQIVEAMEGSKRRPLREYEQVARVLGLDERLLSIRSTGLGNERVAVRLRHLSDEKPAMSHSVVASLAEASWVAMTQMRLEEELGLHRPKLIFHQSNNYRPPTYRVGYELADVFRRNTGRSNNPIESMRELVETDLAIPVVQAPLGERIAGATVQAESGRRAIVLNINGKNSDARVRRTTIAHELCHLLFDPNPQLQDLRVDEYAELEERDDVRTDPVEQRANAFAVQLLVPQQAALDLYRTSGEDLGQVIDRFGVSFTAARYQVWNGLKRSITLDKIQSPNHPSQQDWDARETYTLAYHPIRKVVEHPSRAGRFSAIVVKAATVRLISWDTAAEWLFCTQNEAEYAEGGLRDFYPDVFAA